MPRDYYEVLGVARDASEADIKKAYRKLARQYHPDRNPGDKQAESNFKEVQGAYEVLSDKSKRANYDKFGFAGANAGAGGPGGGPFRWGGAGAEGGTQFDFQGFDPNDLASIFRQFGGAGGMGGATAEDVGEVFGRRGRGRARRAKPPEAEAEISIPFMTAALGGKVPLRVDDHEIDLKVPAGVEDGKKLRLGGQGPGGGDLIVKLKVEPHPYFRREGNNLVLEVPLSVPEAVLGTTVEVPTLDGSRLMVKVPSGASSGARLRLRGKGLNGGDELIEIKVVAPKPADERSRELMEEFGRLNPQSPRAGLPWS
ncbi:MAG TPA: J domain-containing protein [Gemmataceae bacterium]|jgi:DnaJ-class molecular chaperone|nr:J domain-containing protein [Gemmataceae bacterium]